jgi:hypothetical protein
LHGGTDHAGIVFRTSGGGSLGNLIRGLELIWEVLDDAEMRNRVEYV